MVTQYCGRLHRLKVEKVEARKSAHQRRKEQDQIAVVRSASPLLDKQLDQVETWLKKRFARKVEFTTVVDPMLLEV